MYTHSYYFLQNTLCLKLNYQQIFRGEENEFKGLYYDA